MSNRFYTTVLPIVASLPSGVVLYELFLFNE